MVYNKNRKIFCTSGRINSTRKYGMFILEEFSHPRRGENVSFHSRPLITSLILESDTEGSLYIYTYTHTHSSRLPFFSLTHTINPIRSPCPFHRLGVINLFLPELFLSASLAEKRRWPVQHSSSRETTISYAPAFSWGVLLLLLLLLYGCSQGWRSAILHLRNFLCGLTSFLGKTVSCGRRASCILLFFGGERRFRVSEIIGK